MELCRSARVSYFCDAVQWIGKHLAPGQLCRRCGAAVASGHKFGGPKGTGFLILGDEWRGLKVAAGGAQEIGSRAGTENLPGILAMVTALETRCGQTIEQDSLSARDRFEARLQEHWPDELVIHGSGALRSWNTSLMAMPAHRADRWISRLDRFGFQVSNGSACSSGKAGPSPVLRAMGVDPEVARRTLRISSGWETSSADWDQLFQAMLEVRALLDGESNSEGPGQVIEI